MKAYVLSVKNDPDQGQALIWANTARAARNEWNWILDCSWIDRKVRRAPAFDDMENEDNEVIALKKWYEGWKWFYYTDVPDVETNTDEQFIEWYEREF